MMNGSTVHSIGQLRENNLLNRHPGVDAGIQHHGWLGRFRQRFSSAGHFGGLPNPTTVGGKAMLAIGICETGDPGA